MGSFEFDFVHQVSIKSGWKYLADTCQVVLPRNLKFQGRSIKELLRVGDKLEVKLGYDGELQTEFQGYLTGISAEAPIKLKAEDKTWLLRQVTVSKSYKDANLKQVLTDILPAGTTFSSLDADLGPLRIDRLSVAQVLEQLRQKFGLQSYWRGEELVVGWPYPVLAPERIYNRSLNVIKSDLQYKTKDDVKLKVKAISNLPNGGKIEVSLGDPEGAERSLNYFNLSKAELQRTAERELERIKYEGYKGSFQAFGLPFCAHGDAAKFIDPNAEERTGVYSVDEVITTFGIGGFRRKISLGPKARVCAVNW